MQEWPYALGTYNHDLVRVFCVQDQSWQKVRLSMKGISTPDKLKVLAAYRAECIENDRHGMLTQRYQVQIDNYINALKRGGQLTMDLKVQR